MKDKTGGGLGQWLQEKCQQEHLSLREAGDKSDLSHTTIQVIIRSGRASAETVKKLAHAFSDSDSNYRLALEDQLLQLAGYRSTTENKLSEPVAQLVDIVADFSGSQLRVMREFAIYLDELKKKRQQ